MDYCIIEVNARLSRSSALASKATGYPLAYVACKLALGKSLTDIRNSVTKKTTACFEPSLDYCVVKVPRWDLKKFSRVSRKIGSAMKSVGEVMSIGKTFTEAFQKAIRMLDGGCDGFGDVPSSINEMTREELEDELRNPTDQRVYAISAAFERGYTIDQLYQMTCIDKWFLYKLQSIISMQNVFKHVKDLYSVPIEILSNAKKIGFSDRQIGRCTGVSELEVRKYRLQQNIRPYVKQIDTLAAEFPAQTNYLYMTYNGVEHDLDFNEHGIVVLGCGAYRIGSSCEFDWCAVNCLRTLKQLGFKSVMVNYNPETVSTDYDECDRLYFEELTLERVLDIYEQEMSSGVIISVGGQIANNLALPLHRQGVRVLGTHPNSIDNAEDRNKFSALLDSIKIDQPLWKQLTNFAEARQFAEKVGYPVLVRPSYVLSGAAMSVAYNDEDLNKFLTRASATAAISNDAPVVISKFITGAKEIEIDAVAKGGKILNYAISEHVENAGVHSGDATLVLPAQKLYVETIRLIKKAAAGIAENLNITGPFNIQFLSKDNEIKVIECNLRASRSFPFVSKTFNVNFIELATKAMVGAPVKSSQIDLSDIHYVNIKAPIFSFTRLQGADPVLSVEMASTGEVACFGESRQEAFLKALFSAGFKMPKRNILISAGPLQSKLDLVGACRTFKKLGFHLFATESTAKFMQEQGIEVTLLYKNSSGKSPTAVEALQKKQIDLVINIPHTVNPEELTDGYLIRRAAVDFNVSLLTNIKTAVLFAHAIDKVRKISIKSWDEYLRASKLIN
jgi:carbamoyl-phosphate synthase large subunit